MNIRVIVAHPQLHSGSRIHHRLAEELAKHKSIAVHDLYAAYPDERLDVEREQQLLEQADRVILQFPVWWYSSPSLLKKWLDEVLAYGWAHGPEGDRLRGKELGLAVSTGSPQSSYQAGGYNQFTMSEMMRPFQATANVVGMTFLPIFTVHGAVSCTEEGLEQYAEEYIRYLTN